MKFEDLNDNHDFDDIITYGQNFMKVNLFKEINQNFKK